MAVLFIGASTIQFAEVKTLASATMPDGTLYDDMPAIKLGESDCAGVRWVYIAALYEECPESKS